MWPSDYLVIAMFATMVVLMFSGYPVALVFGGVGFLFGLLGILIDAFSFIEFFNIVARIWGGICENLVLVAVPMFIFMGVMLERSRAATDLLVCLEVLLRRVPGGLALAVTLMGTVLAATTGIIGASVVMLSLIALPTMLACGYSKELATGTIAAAGCLGIIVPPSIMLVIQAELLQISVGTLFIGAVFPGLALAGLYLAYIILRAIVDPGSAPRATGIAGPESGFALVKMVLRSFVPPTFLTFIVLGSIFFGWTTPTEAAGVGALGTILLAAANRQLTLARLREVVDTTATTCGMVFFIFMGATMFSYVFRSLGGDDLVLNTLQELGLGSWGILVLVLAVTFAMGFVFDWIEIVLIVLPIFGPVIAQLDFGGHVETQHVLTWFAILMAVNLQTSFLTPPFAFALFYIKGVAPPEVGIVHLYRGVIPFVLLQLVGIGLLLAYPSISLWLPTVLID